MAYLDDTGLAYFWGKIKAYIAALLAPKADDSDVVHKTGAETVGGVKTFTSETHHEDALMIQNDEAERGVVPASTKYFTLAFFDRNGFAVSNRFGVVECAANNAGEVEVYLCADRNQTSPDEHAMIRVGWDANGVPFGAAPSTSSSRSSGYDIVTRDWIPNDTRIVHTSGDETINGIKSFSHFCKYTSEITKGVLPSQKTYYNLPFLDSAYATGTATGTRLGMVEGFVEPSGLTAFGIFDFKFDPTENKYSYVMCKYDLTGDYGYVDSSPIRVYLGTNAEHFTAICGGRQRTVAPSTRQANVILPVKDVNGNILCGLYSVQETDGSSFFRLINYDTTNTSSNYAFVEVQSDASGNLCARATATPANANGNEIVTAGWANSKYVSLSNDQLIGGNKTFSNTVSVNNNNFVINKSGLVRSSSNPQYSGYQVGNFCMLDKNGKELSKFQCTVDGGGATIAMLVAYQLKSDSDVTCNVGLINPFNSTDYTFRPFSDNNIKLGTASRRWSVVYAGTGSINTSDRRMKTDFAAIPDEVLDAWSETDFLQFRMLDSVEEKGSAARLHSGMIAQDIQEAFARHGLDASRYGLFCHDSWEHKDEMRDETGHVLEAELPAGDRYSLRYEEALCMEAACMRRENARLKARIASLEDRLAALELRLGSE